MERRLLASLVSSVTTGKKIRGRGRGVLPRQISPPRKVAIASPIGRGYAGRHVGTARARIRIRQVATVMLIACMITPIFNLLTSEASLRSAIQGVFDGAFISLLVAGYLMFIRDGELRVWFRRL